jgi:hypothetical protein
MSMADRVISEFTVVVTEGDVDCAMGFRERPENWEGFLNYLRSNLEDAMLEHLRDEIRFLAEIYMEYEAYSEDTDKDEASE